MADRRRIVALRKHLEETHGCSYYQEPARSLYTQEVAKIPKVPVKCGMCVRLGRIPPTAPKSVPKWPQDVQDYARNLYEQGYTDYEAAHLIGEKLGTVVVASAVAAFRNVNGLLKLRAENKPCPTCGHVSPVQELEG